VLSIPCVIVTPSLVVQCVGPAGVGLNHTVSLIVDGAVPSVPYTNHTLSYAPPVVLGLTITSMVSTRTGTGSGTGAGLDPGAGTGAAPGASGDTVGTCGGSVVVIAPGGSFGPRDLSHVTLGWLVQMY
jgi:hypothetical protein